MSNEEKYSLTQKGWRRLLASKKARIARLEQEVKWLLDFAERLAAEARRARASEAAYKRAKEENDERFMLERDEARAEAKRLAGLQVLVNEQAEDDGLWFRAETAPEAYLQAALRRLHAAVEAQPHQVERTDSATTTDDVATNNGETK